MSASARPAKRTDRRGGPTKDRRNEAREVAEDTEFAGIAIEGRRRRPSGEASLHPYRLRASGVFWLSTFGVVVAVWVALFVSNAPDPLVERLDDWLLRGMARFRTSFLTEVARGVAMLGSVWALIALRWATIAVLVAFRRWRHLVAFIGSVFILRIVVAVLNPAFGRPRPPGIPILGDWEGYSHPSRPVASLAVAAVGAAFALVPPGRWRRLAFRVGGALIALLGLARMYLAVDHPSDVIFAVVLGVAFAVIAFRVFCPSSVFPVSYRRGRTAHLEVDGVRRRAIRTALRRQLGLEVGEIEPFGLEGSGGSTPLLLHVKGRDGARLFGKLYAETHLRSDRWYKLGRAILYGALEDEAAFNSVRQLVEYEDYMLRVMQDAGVPTAAPLGFVELVPEREYLIVTEFLKRAEEADDAEIDDDVIDRGIAIVRTLWNRGIAHRDLKPANVMIQDGDVKIVDVAFGQVRPSPWRQAVDLANMMLVLALSTDAKRVYERATQVFRPKEIAEAFAATKGVTMPSQLREALKEDGRDLVEEFRRLAPSRRPISIQRWSVRRVVLSVRAGLVVGIVVLLVVVGLANPGAP